MIKKLLVLFLLLGKMSYTQAIKDTTNKEFNYRYYNITPCTPCPNSTVNSKNKKSLSPYQIEKSKPILIKDSIIIEWLKKEQTIIKTEPEIPVI